MPIPEILELHSGKNQLWRRRSKSSDDEPNQDAVRPQGGSHSSGMANPGFSRVWAALPEANKLTVDERDRLAERGAASTGVTHRGVFVPDRHAAKEDEPLRGGHDLRDRLANL